jgi:pimeloyl-ACP methyl ester carboxylesterase
MVYGGGFVAVLGSILLITSGIHAATLTMFSAKNPPPGELIDVGGFRMHILAEGENDGNPSLVFIPGGHGPGYFLYNFHKIFRDETRSILYDRATSGWSDVGPFPRTSYREAEELHLLLENAGETSPVVLVGHSYGGMLGLIYAMRYPDNVAGLVLLDSGFAELYQNAGAAASLKYVQKTTLRQGFLSTFGVPDIFHNEQYAEAVNAVLAVYERELFDVWEVLEASAPAAMNQYGGASLYGEFDDPAAFETGLIRAGALDGVPVSSVTYLGGTDLYSREAMDFVLNIRPDLDEAGAQGQLDGLDRTRKIIFNLSDRLQTYSVPEGASHNFVYEIPDFTSALIRDMLRRIKDPTAQPILGADLPHGWRGDSKFVSDLADPESN